MNFLEKRQWKKLLKGCNYYHVAERIGMALDGGLISRELATLLDAYCSNPCLETAVDLIKFDLQNNKNTEDTSFAKLFILASDAGSEMFDRYFRSQMFGRARDRKTENDKKQDI